MENTIIRHSLVSGRQSQGAFEDMQTTFQGQQVSSRITHQGLLRPDVPQALSLLLEPRTKGLCLHGVDTPGRQADRYMMLQV